MTSGYMKFVVCPSLLGRGAPWATVMQGMEQVHAAATVTTTGRKVHPPKFAQALSQPWHISLNLP